MKIYLPKKKFIKSTFIWKKKKLDFTETKFVLCNQEIYDYKF